MMVGEGIGKPVDGRSVVSRSGQTQGLRPSRISANWVPEQKMVELIANGNRFAWRVVKQGLRGIRRADNRDLGVTCGLKLPIDRKIALICKTN